MVWPSIYYVTGVRHVDMMTYDRVGHRLLQHVPDIGDGERIARITLETGIEWLSLDPNWSAWYVTASVVDSSFYVNQDVSITAVERYNALGQLVATGPDLLGTDPAKNVAEIFVHTTGVYVMVKHFWNPNTVMRLARLSLDLTTVHYDVEVKNPLHSISTGNNPMPFNDHITVDGAGNAWVADKPEIFKVSPAGVVTAYDLSATFPVTSAIRGQVYDPVSNSLLLIAWRDYPANGPGPIVARFALATEAIDLLYTGGDLIMSRWVSRSAFFRGPVDGKIWLRKPMGSAGTENGFEFIEFDIPTMSIVRILHPYETWEIDISSTENAGELEGYLYDDYHNALWGFVDAIGTQEFGVWYLALQETPPEPPPPPAPGALHLRYYFKDQV